MSAARDAIYTRLAGSSFPAEVIGSLLDEYRDEVQREDAATVRAQAPKYLDGAENIAVFLALDKAAALIEPDAQ